MQIQLLCFAISCLGRARFTPGHPVRPTYITDTNINLITIEGRIQDPLSITIGSVYWSRSRIRYFYATGPGSSTAHAHNVLGVVF